MLNTMIINGRIRMMKKVIVAAIVLPLSLMISQVSAETISCVLENNKVVTASNLASNPVYSYGTAGNVELSLPSSSANSRVYKGSEMFSGGGSTYLAFTNGAYTYVLYNGIGRDWEFEGLRVYKDAEIIVEKQCKQYGSTVFDYDAVHAPEGELPY